jgi:hypothetical protein
MPKAIQSVVVPSAHKTPSDHSAAKAATPPDLIFENHFSIFLIRPVSPAGKTWLDENVGDEETQTWGGAIVCEPRYIDAIAYGAIQAGLVISQ